MAFFHRKSLIWVLDAYGVHRAVVNDRRHFPGCSSPQTPEVLWALEPWQIARGGDDQVFDFIDANVYLKIELTHTRIGKSGVVHGGSVERCIVVVLISWTLRVIHGGGARYLTVVDRTIGKWHWGSQQNSPSYPPSPSGDLDVIWRLAATEKDLLGVSEGRYHG
jgi:hypothetical protein